MAAWAETARLEISDRFSSRWGDFNVFKNTKPDVLFLAAMFLRCNVPILIESLLQLLLNSIKNCLSQLPSSVRIVTSSGLYFSCIKIIIALTVVDCLSTGCEK